MHLSETTTPANQNTSFEAVNARACAYEQLGGGAILRFEIVGGPAIQFVLQAELLFDFYDHMKQARIGRRGLRTWANPSRRLLLEFER